MITRRWCAAILQGCTFLSLAGCRLPGKPGPDQVSRRPDQQLSFDVLYQTNCQACHGRRGMDGAAISLANPVYIAYAGPQRIADITANGIPGSSMPAFAKQQGGLLTEQQIYILASGIVSQWGRPGTVAPPAYESSASGDAQNGESLYRSACLRCHTPGPASILSPTYLALITDQGLRTWIVAGKPEAGMPGWRDEQGGPLTDQQIAYLVSFLASHRISDPGQPFPAFVHSHPSSEKP